MGHPAYGHKPRWYGTCKAIPHTSASSGEIEKVSTDFPPVLTTKWIDSSNLKLFSKLNRIQIAVFFNGVLYTHKSSLLQNLLI